MKGLGLIIAAALTLTGVAAAPAAAATTAAESTSVRVVERTKVRYERDRGWDRGRHYGRSKWRWRT